MDLETAIQSESEREKQIEYINRYMWNLEKWYKWTYLQSRNRDADIENKHFHQCGKGGGVNWKAEIDVYINMLLILCIE